jgi:uncharacterized RDD family membrane protein YckC
MFREQRRLRTAPPAPLPGVQIADIPQRAMAVILDFLIVIPIIWQVMVEVSSSLAERMVPGDARFFAFVGMCVAVNTLYHMVMEAATGASLGKWILGLRVLKADGTRLGVGGAILRNLLRTIEGEASLPLLGALVMANSARRQRLGDLLARTIVVQVPPTAAAPARPA